MYRNSPRINKDTHELIDTPLQDLIERASNASKRLQRIHPKMHYSLKIKNLDMAFILVENDMKPILDAIKIGHKNKDEFNRLIEGMVNEN